MWLLGVWPLEGVDHWRVWPLGVWPLEGGHWVCGPLEGVALEVWTIRGVAIGCVAIGEDVDNWRVWPLDGSTIKLVSTVHLPPSQTLWTRL